MFYLVRHGKTDYSEKDTKIYQGFGVNLAPLSDKGIEDARRAAEDERLSGLDLILSSPYTRALQTAAIISERTGAPIRVETELHEWLADRKYRYVSDKKAGKRYRKYIRCEGVYPKGKKKPWEDKASLRARMDRVLDRYQDAGKVAVVCHGMIIEAATGEKLKTGGIAEYPGKRDRGPGKPERALRAGKKKKDS